MLRSACKKSAECMYAYLSYTAIKAVRLGSASMMSAECMYAYLSYIAIRAVRLGSVSMRSVSACTLIFRTLLSEQ